MTEAVGVSSAQERRAEIAAVLLRYPAVQPRELEDLLHWFRDEASALDVGLIASDPALSEPYRRLADDHLGRLGRVEWAMTGAIAVVLLALVAWFAF